CSSDLATRTRPTRCGCGSSWPRAGMRGPCRRAWTGWRSRRPTERTRLRRRHLRTAFPVRVGHSPALRITASDAPHRPEDPMNSLFRLAATFAAGAAAMYYFDPIAGRRRRAVTRDRTVAACHDAEHYARGKLRRAADRAQGLVAEARSRVAAPPVTHERLHERLRATLGHPVERPAAIEVAVDEGSVV